MVFWYSYGWNKNKLIFFAFLSMRSFFLLLFFIGFCFYLFFGFLPSDQNVKLDFNSKKSCVLIINRFTDKNPFSFWIKLTHSVPSFCSIYVCVSACAYFIQNLRVHKNFSIHRWGSFDEYRPYWKYYTPHKTHIRFSFPSTYVRMFRFFCFSEENGLASSNKAYNRDFNVLNLLLHKSNNKKIV